MQYLTPDQVKGYTVHRKISEGGFGEVYLATETRPNFEREVVLKRILPKFGNDPRFIQRFESEARMIARLEYPYIVPLYDYWRNPDGAYLVMRWLKGGSVKDLLEQGPLDLPTAARIMNQICSALALAHKNGVIHRDIKPGNILLDEEGNAYLSDFGIAKDFMKFDSNTQPEDILGSPKYISPEQARSEVVTPRTDVYSLGVTLYEMLAGEHPFPNANMYDLIYKHLNEPLPQLTNLDAVVQDDINLVIQKATTKDPQKRYESALDFARAFHAAAQLDSITQADTLEQHLTIREQQVLSLIVDGKTNKEIANELFVSAETVKWHISNAYRKLGVSRRQQAIVVARNLQLVGSDAIVAPGDATSYIIDFEAENPYKGLESFTEADEGNFFGREKLVDKLVKRLAQDHQYQRFLAVLGPSGSGKSSLVRAGLVPALWEGRLPDATQWLYVTMIPRLHPVDELDIALRSVATKHTEDISDLLAHNERGLLKAARLILPEGDHELLLIIDQFEEIFTLVESEEERVHFLNLIANAVTDPDSRVRVVITIRADYYDRPLYYPQFGDILRDRVETVLPLSAEEMQAAIVQPARKVGVKFEDGLVATIISDINYQPGSLPLLQYALTEMFDQRDSRTITRAVYEKIGGAAGAIASTAEELFLSYDEAGQETIRQMFLRLVTLGEGAEDTRRRTARDELLSIADDPYLMDEIIDTYAYARMMSLDNDPTTREPTVEVAHEAILREWERLRGWLNDSRDDIKTQRRLSHDAESWAANNRDSSYLVSGTRLEQFERWSQDTSLLLSLVEQQFLDASLADRERREAKEEAQAQREANLQLRARRVLQGLVAVFLIAAIVSAGFGFEANRQRGIAKKAQSEAETERDNALAAQQQESEARQQAERSADIAQSLALSSAADVALTDGDVASATAFAFYANQISDPPAYAKSVLYEVSNASPGLINRFFVGQIAGIQYSVLIDDRETLLMVDVEPPEPQIIQLNINTGDQTSVTLPLGELWSIAGFFWHDYRSLITVHAEFPLEGENGDSVLSEWDVDTGELLRTLDLPASGPFVTFNSPRVAPEDAAVSWFWSATVPESNTIGLSGWHMVGGSEEDGNHGMVANLVIDYEGWEIETPQYDATDVIWGFSHNMLEKGRPVQWLNVTQTVEDQLEQKMIGYDLYTGDIIHEFPLPGGIVEQMVTTSPEGNYVFTLVDDSNNLTYQYIDGETLEVIFEMESPSFVGIINNVGGAFNEDETLFITGTHNGQMALWDMRDGSLMHVFNQVGGYLGATFFDNDRKLLTFSDDNLVSIWSLENSPFIDANLSDASLAADRSAVDPSLEHWVTYQSTSDPQTGDVVNTVSRFDWQEDGYAQANGITFNTEGMSRIHTISIAPDGSELAAIDDDLTIVIWDYTSGERLRQFQFDPPNGNFGEVGIRYSGDSQTLLIFYGNGYGGPYGGNAQNIAAFDTISGNILWNLNAGDFQNTFGPLYIIDQHNFSIMMYGTNQGSSRVGLLDVETGEILRSFGEEGITVQSADITRDQNTLVTTNSDGLIRFYDLKTGEQSEKRRLAFDPARMVGLELLGANDEYLFLFGFGANNSYVASVVDAQSNEVIRTLQYPQSLTGWFFPNPVDPYRVVIYSQNTEEVFNLDLKLDHGALLEWIDDNRFIRELTQLECLQYQVPQFCEE